MQLKEKHKRIVEQYVTYRRVHFQDYLTDDQVIDNLFMNLDFEMRKYLKDLKKQIDRTQKPMF